MAKSKKFNRTEKKLVRSYEKDEKEDQNLWQTITGIHKKDEGIAGYLAGLFKQEHSKKPAKKK
jgi:recombinational DNA repair ATPase RecF